MNPLTTLTYTPEKLLDAYENIRSEQKGIRIRDAARKLSVSEAQLLACQIPNGTVKRLALEAEKLLHFMAEMGMVMSIMRNEACVLEHTGIFPQPKVVHRNICLIVGEIEQRLFLNHWKTVFAVETLSRGETLKSIQVFDEHGNAIVKFYTRPESKAGLYAKIVSSYRSDNQSNEQSVTPTEVKALKSFDKEGLLEGWKNMKDTHDFHMLLHRFGADRLEAVKAAEGAFSEKIHDKTAILKVLETMAAEKMPIMIFVGNKGGIQIHQDVIQNVKVLENWYNVMDPHFNLHYNSDEISEIYLVKKPTEDGIVTAIEAFDHSGELAVQFFGLRKPGNPESEAWRGLAEAQVR